MELKLQDADGYDDNGDDIDAQDSEDASDSDRDQDSIQHFQAQVQLAERALMKLNCQIQHQRKCLQLLVQDLAQACIDVYPELVSAPAFAAAHSGSTPACPAWLEHVRRNLSFGGLLMAQSIEDFQDFQLISGLSLARL